MAGPFAFLTRVGSKAGKSIGKATFRSIWEMARIVFYGEIFLFFRKLLFKTAWVGTKIGIFLLIFEQAVSAVESLASSFAAPLPGELSQGIGMVLPNNFSACLSAILTAKFIILLLSIKDSVLSST